MSEESKTGLGALEIDGTTVNIHTGATASEQTVTMSTDSDSTITGILTNSNTDNINIGHVNNNGPTATLNNGPTVNVNDNGFANRASTGTTTAGATAFVLDTRERGINFEGIAEQNPWNRHWKAELQGDWRRTNPCQSEATKNQFFQTYGTSDFFRLPFSGDPIEFARTEARGEDENAPPKYRIEYEPQKAIRSANNDYLAFQFARQGVTTLQKQIFCAAIEFEPTSNTNNGTDNGNANVASTGTIPFIPTMAMPIMERTLRWQNPGTMEDQSPLWL
jgi:hypothetical protein